MNPETLIHKYYADQPELEQILLTHSRQVADLCMQICDAHPELGLDRQFLYEAAMLHDIGIVRCDAPGIQCFGTDPYICHGRIGAEMLRNLLGQEAESIARVCERHTGAGLTEKDIVGQDLPLPHQDFLPETIAEQVICYADKFYSKSHLEREKTVEQAARSLAKFGSEGVERFRKWAQMFE
jgi:uncharacterized protein